MEYFLFESRQGPDYLFATSGAVLLRSLGYQTRIVSGIYADPQNYDRMAKATGVFSNNVHFWLEVETENGHWVAVEATPGFNILYARQTFLQSAAAAIAECSAQILARPILSSLFVFAVIGSVVSRRQLFRLAATLWWKVQLNASPRQQVLRSVLLLHRLATQRKSGRREGQTIDAWINTLGDSSHDSAIVSEFPIIGVVGVLRVVR